MTDSTLSNRRIHVVGATRGLGRGIAAALAEGGASVLAIGRSTEALAELREATGVDTRAGDASSATFVSNVFDDDPPDGVVIVAGARPALGPLSSYDWESFSAPWETDVKVAFHWLQHSLRRPWPTGRHVVVFSSAAARAGSPLSGGYAGAKQTQRFMCKYATGEARARELPLNVQCVMPLLSPETGLGAAAVRAYAQKAGEDEGEFLRKRFGETPLSPEIAGREITRLMGDPVMHSVPEFLLMGEGLRALL